ncbi:MAG TPA: DUF3631 domain-containing protein [Candidatus Acidoferrales bacterium]|nr:DUF3631 domain-containing protein [Candidatus Acidoferrales bacterium]
MNEKNENPALIFESIVPHPEPVVVGELLTEIENTIKKHVVLSDAAATALAVWVLHTYVYERRNTVAYVAIESPEKRCGKTTLLSVLAAMASKPLIASNVTVGALFRAIDTCRPTLFIDEADTFLAGSSTMRGIINSGNTWRTAYVIRSSKSKSKQSRAREQAEAGEGADQKHTNSGLERYSCWCPKVIAMIGKVPDTIADRSIVVPMARKLVSEARAPLAQLEPSAIKAKCARFAQDQGRAIGQCGKIHGDGLNDRAADTFDPLYVIARLAGEHWEQKLHTAALALAPIVQSRNSGAELLLDIYTVFALSSGEKMFTRHLIATLSNEEFATASMAAKYSSIDEFEISKRLRPYGIKPSLIRIGKKVGKGYWAKDFTEALARYVPDADVEARMKEVERENKLWDEQEELEAAEAG